MHFFHIGKPHRDAIGFKRPQLLHETVFEFRSPLPLQKRNDLFPPNQKLAAISSARVDGITEKHLLQITRIPSILCKTNLQDSAFPREWG